MPQDATRRILALTRKPDSPSFEQRVLRYIEPLAERGIEVSWRVIPRKRAQQRRMLDEAGTYDAVWLHRYLLPPLHARRWRAAIRRLVFDFDDPLTFTAKRGGAPSLSRRIKFASTLRRCDGVLAASPHLAGLASPYFPDPTVLPMAVDLPDPPVVPAAAAGSSKVPTQLLWVGSRATLPFLDGLGLVLARLREARTNVTLRLVAHEPREFGALRVDYRPWSPEAQDAALRECDIGLCPMPDTPWTRGKCPYKVLQYMAYGLAWVGAAVGENVRVAGENRGLCAATDEQWIEHLTRLVDTPAKRTAMGAAAQAYIREHHDRDTLTGRLADFWRRA